MHQEIIKKWNDLFSTKTDVEVLEKSIHEYILGCRWFGGKSRKVDSIEIVSHQKISNDNFYWYVCLLQCNYSNGQHEWYSLPIGIINDPALPTILRLNENYSVIDALQDGLFRNELFHLMMNENSTDEIVGYKSKTIKDFQLSVSHSKILNVEQSNTSVIFNNSYFFKWFRKVDVGENPDLQTIKFLSEETTFKNIPSYVAHLNLKYKGNSILLGMMQEAIDNEGDAWFYVCNELKLIYNQLLNDTNSTLHELIHDEFKDKIKLLGQRTAELHNALASGNKINGFNPESFDIDYQLWVYDCFEKIVANKFELLEQNQHLLALDTKLKAQKIIEAKSDILQFFKKVLSKSIFANKIRVHGDYHLGQVLYSHGDFKILDFEGEPDKPHAMRTIKYTGLRDVAGMLRSFDYAAKAVLMQNFESPAQNKLPEHATTWCKEVSELFLANYKKHANNIVFPNADTSEDLLNFYLLEKIVYELGYELNNRPTWVEIPLNGLYDMVLNLEPYFKK